jgi:hypothetical protein
MFLLFDRFPERFFCECEMNAPLSASQRLAIQGQMDHASEKTVRAYFAPGKV